MRRRTKAEKAARAAMIPQQVVDNSPVPCTSGSHRWPADFDYGDTCNCGEFYLLKDAIGRVEIQETPRGEDG